MLPIQMSILDFTWTWSTMNRPLVFNYFIALSESQVICIEVNKVSFSRRRVSLSDRVASALI